MRRSRIFWLAAVTMAVSTPPAAADERKNDQPTTEKKQEQKRDNGRRTTVFMVGHAELEKYPPHDPTLSYEGRNRARGLRDTLRYVPLSAIYVSEFRASNETARPTSLAKDIKTIQFGGPEVNKLVEALRTEHVGQSVLVIRPIIEIRTLLKQLGVKEDQIPRISPRAVDNLLIATLYEDGSADVVRLHYKKLSFER